MKRSYVVVTVTTSSKDQAENIVRALLDERLIACANIVSPVCSIFRWADSIETAEECMVFMKTRADLFEEVSEKVKAIHSYEIPEIVAIPIVKGSEGYMKWLENCLK